VRIEADSAVGTAIAGEVKDGMNVVRGDRRVRIREVGTAQPEVENRRRIVVAEEGSSPIRKTAAGEETLEAHHNVAAILAVVKPWESAAVGRASLPGVVDSLAHD
jgi:hypothetical protein